MNFPPSIIARQLLVDASLATPVENGEPWPVFVSFLPDEPDLAICLYDTAGNLDGRIMLTGEQVVHPGIMVWVRERSYLNGWRRASNMATLFEGVRNSIIIIEDEVYKVKSVSRSGDILPLGVDEVGSRRRHQFSINLLMTVVLHSAIPSDAAPFYVASGGGGNSQYIVEPDQPYYINLN